MVYVVKTRKGYYEERESYRDENGKPRSRFLRYLGKLGEIDWKATLQGDPEDRAMAAAERYGAEVDARRAPEVEAVSQLPTGLHPGPVDPTPVDCEHQQPADAAQALDGEPSDAGSDDASGS